MGGNGHLITMQYYVQLLDQTAVFEILCSVWHCIVFK